MQPVHWPVIVSLLFQWTINYDFISLTFAPHANKMRISSSGCINIIASARARCSGFVTHSPGILNNRTVNWEIKNQFHHFQTSISQSYVIFCREIRKISRHFYKLPLSIVGDLVNKDFLLRKKQQKLGIAIQNWQQIFLVEKYCVIFTNGLTYVNWTNVAKFYAKNNNITHEHQTVRCMCIV